MSQALSVPPVLVSGSTAAPAMAETAENSGSGLSFDQALADQLAADAPLTEVSTDPQPGSAVPLPPADLAAPGKDLPLPLPPAPVLSLALETLSPEPVGDEIASRIVAAGEATSLGFRTGPVPVPVTAGSSAVSSSPELMARDGHSFPAPATAAGDAGRQQSAMQEAVRNPAEPLARVAADGELQTAATDSIRSSADEPEVRPAMRFDPAPVSMTSSALATGIVTTVHAQAAAAASTPPTLTASIPVPLGQAQWGQSLGQQVVWVMNQGVQGAELRLSPAELGPLSVRISLDQDQATISFSSAHAAVREAVEAALPRLRDMLGAQGINLADVNVSHQHSSQAQRDPGGDGAPRSRPAVHGEPDVDSTASAGRVVATGMLDVYA